MAKSGARLREVGTTNRTRLSDYENAITENTRLLLRVHRSNFAMVGFTEQPSAEELVSLGRRRGIPVMEDLGNGLLLELATVGVHGEHGLRESVAAGVDVVCVSGDKLLGGPQAGIIAGNKELIARMRSNPLFRALRVDKLTYAALEATFLAYIREDYRGIPALHMIYAPAEEIRARADAFVERVALPEPSKAEVIDGESVIGGGTAPNATLPTALVVIRSSRFSPEELQTRLRAQSPAVIGRIEEERLVLDLRTVFPEQEEQLRNAIERTLGS
jgi:L-seryl-tRNA(Ser) seleniumtransferase